MDIRFTNCVLFTEGGFKRRDLCICGSQISADCSGEVVDCGGSYLLPGFLDIHIHGAAGAEFTDTSSLETMGRHLLSHGITSFCPTSVSRSEEELSAMYSAFKAFEEAPPVLTARTLGINMEGPFLSEERRGAHKKKYLIPPSMDLFLKLYHASGERIAIVSVAPEIEGALAFAEAAQNFCAVSAAHTEAPYEIALEFYRRGGSLLTHLYNAMPPLCSREPGVMAAAFERAQYVTLICDGYHVLPPAVRAAFQLFSDRIILISDGMAALGMGNGEYTLGELAVTVENKRATLKDGTLAGGATDLFDCVRNAVDFGISLHEAVTAATVRPAKAIGQFDRLGSLEVGKVADILVVKPDLTLEQVYLSGCRVK